MPYVRRLPDGQIASLHKEREVGADEFLPSGHAELLAFVGDTSTDDASFQRLDADFVRVIEDVIDTLIGKNVINITDLPPEAQAKLFARKTFRERSSQHALRLFEPTDFNDVI